MPRQIVSHADLIDALKKMTARFTRCAIHAGSDPEFVEGATAETRALLANAEAMYSHHPVDMDAAFDRLLNEIGAHQ